MATIVLIEDNPDLRDNTAEILELEGHSVETATNGEDGLAMVKDILPDLILCDILMPGMNGYELLVALKSFPPASAIPFIFLTANAEQKEVKHGLEMGANGYIRKPFEAQELLLEIDRCLGNK
ncbi:MAG TPA: response regulator [Bacteroidia bacterium]|jgi:CheY-like chemotaxis protein|nr:response regulator [Bacteroidia bacterium]